MTILRLMNNPQKIEIKHATFFRAISAKEGFHTLSQFVRRYIKRFVYNIETALITSYGSEDVLKEIYKEKQE